MPRIKPEVRGRIPRIRSTRGYRRIVDHALSQVSKGRLSPTDGMKIASMAKAGVELMLTEHELHGAGLTDQEVQDYADGEDGGLEPWEIRVFTKIKRKLVEGVNKEGDKISTEEVVIEGGQEVADVPSTIEDILAAFGAPSGGSDSA